jgi:hypothetical protein
MTVSAHELWDIIIAAWNWPVSLRTLPYQSLEYVHDPSVSPRDVLSKLLNNYSQADIETTITQFLESIAVTFQRTERPTLRELFLAHSCIMLLTLRGGPCGPTITGDLGGNSTKLSIAIETVKHIVESFPPVGWYIPVGWLIEAYLTDCDVLESLCAGLTKPHPLEMLLWLLDGFRLYKGLARKLDSNPNRISVVAEVRQVLEMLEHNHDKSVCDAAKSARSYLSQYLGNT